MSENCAYTVKIVLLHHLHLIFIVLVTLPPFTAADSAPPQLRKTVHVGASGAKGTKR